MMMEFHELNGEDRVGESLTKSCFRSKSNDSTETNKNNDDHNNNDNSFECNICLDCVHDPVVTFCGHLYCWPCIYKWIHSGGSGSEKPGQENPQCPVCKAGVTEKTLVPLYGRDPCVNNRTKSFGSEVPQRPQRVPQNPRWTVSSNRSRSSSRNSNLIHPYQGSYMAAPPQFSLGGAGLNSAMVSPAMVGMFGDTVYGRIFGNNTEITHYTYPNSYYNGRAMSQRMRRRIMEVDRSLNRICFFLFCFMILCLLLF